jgi:uncharacterized protein YbcI
MTVTPLLDSAGRRRSPATLPGYHAGRPPRNKGQQYPADPPSIEEIIAVMRKAGDDRHGSRVRALIAVLWRGGLRVQEALSLGEQDLDQRRGSLLVRRGKGGRRREIGMDTWGWEQLTPWLGQRVELPVGPLFCVIDGPTRGRAWASASVRVEFRRLAVQAGVRRRFAPLQLRHAHAVELAREGVPLDVIQRQLGHANLGTMVALLKEFYGHGPTRTKSYYADDLVVCVLRGGFSRVEETLLEGGRGSAVIQQRMEFQDVMRERFEEVIEHSTGRPVIGFMSGNQQHPDMMCEVFILAPTDLVDPHEVPANGRSSPLG